MKWKYSLDFLRAIAIILVLLHHYESPPDHYFGASIYSHIQKGFNSGVELFFVLSGFLISSHWFSQLKEKVKISDMVKEFYIKRTFRILPLYYLTLFFEAIRATFLTKVNYNIFSYLTLTQNIFGKTIFPVSWSLCVEEHFYLMFPGVSFLFFYFNKIKEFILFCLALFLVPMILRFFYFDDLVIINEQLSQNTIFALAGLIIGVVIAYSFTFYEATVQKLENYLRYIESVGLIFVSLGLYISGSGFLYTKIIFLPAIFSIGYGLFVISANFERSIFNRFKNSFVTLTSKISYPLYLTHYISWMVVGLFFKYCRLEITGIFSFIMHFCAAYGVATFLHLTVERKFLKLRNNLINKSQ